MKYIIILLFFLTSCASWDRTDKTLMASYIVLSGVDAIQTSQAEKEANPLLKKSDGSPDMTKIIALKALIGTGIYFIADQYPKTRRPILIGVNILQGGVVIYNFSVMY